MKVLVIILGAIAIGGFTMGLLGKGPEDFSDNGDYWK